MVSNRSVEGIVNFDGAVSQVASCVRPEDHVLYSSQIISATLMDDGR